MICNFVEDAERQVKYVRQLCRGNSRLQYLVDRDMKDDFYIRCLDWKFVRRAYSESDKLFFMERVNELFMTLVGFLTCM